MTSQEFFDKSLSIMRERDYEVAAERDEDGDQDSSPSCWYRRPDDGVPCLIGAHIQHLYTPDMEDRTVTTLVELYPEVAAVFESVPVFLLRDVQQAHDRQAGRLYHRRVECFEREMANIAQRYSLVYRSPQ